MTAFSLSRIPAIHSSAGSVQNLPQHIRALGCAGTVLLVMDPGLRAAGYIDSIAGILKADGCDLILAVLPPGEPR